MFEFLFGCWLMSDSSTSYKEPKHKYFKKPKPRELTDDEVRKEVIKGWVFVGVLILFLLIVGCYSIEAIKTINHFR